MFRTISNFINLFFTKSRKINNEPINKVSLTVIIIIDLFILFNVFSGLNSISQWHLSPYQAYPCYSEWQSYQDNKNNDRDFQFIRDTLNNAPYTPDNYDTNSQAHLGTVSPICVNFQTLKNNVNQPQNKTILTSIEAKEAEINTLEAKNTQIRKEYDSTLLEKIAGQSSNLSINQIPAQEAKKELDNNNLKIKNLNQKIKDLKQKLLANNNSQKILQLLNSSTDFQQVKQGFDRATFWYPTIQILLQLFFLLPLIFISLLIHKWSLEKGYGLISLMSWHLLVIFFIPLIIKIFDFLQIGVIFEFVLDIINAIFGELTFLISYIYIFLIPLIGFGLIKFFQQIVFNPRNQGSKRVEKSRCLNCGKKIHQEHLHCPHCGYGQYQECPHCHNLTYKLMPYCYHCGKEIES